MVQIKNSKFYSFYFSSREEHEKSLKSFTFCYFVWGWDHLQRSFIEMTSSTYWSLLFLVSRLWAKGHEWRTDSFQQRKVFVLKLVLVYEMKDEENTLWSIHLMLLRDAELWIFLSIGSTLRVWVQLPLCSSILSNPIATSFRLRRSKPTQM
jgi:hypothetical protein